MFCFILCSNSFFMYCCLFNRAWDYYYIKVGIRIIDIITIQHLGNPIFIFRQEMGTAWWVLVFQNNISFIFVLQF